jgi:hypothetical protein
MKLLTTYSTCNHRLFGDLYRRQSLYKLALIAVISISGMMQSCRTVYGPTTANVPLLQEKGELKANLYLTDFQAAYAITDNIGVMVNGQYRKSNTTVSVSVNGGPASEQKILTTNSGAEIGVGYFANTKRFTCFEIYGGVGLPSVKIKDETDKGIGTYNTSGTKFFIQPSIGHVSKGFDIAFTPRFTAVKFGTPTTTYTAKQLTDYSLADVNKSMLFYLEPLVTMRAGYGAFKLQLQTGLSLNLGQKNINSQVFMGNIGLAIDVAKWYKK